MSQADSFDLTITDAVSLTRVVESNVADTIALRGRGGIESGFIREMDALPFVGEMTRDCDPCAGFGVIRLSVEKQQLWQAKLATVRAELSAVPAGKEGDDERKRAGEALRREIENYQKACRCPRCDGYGKTVAPGTQIARTACDSCRGTGHDRDGETCQKCQGRRVASLGIPDSCWNTVSCWRCRGSGEVFNEDAQDVCPVCAGDKCTVPITCRETGNSKKGRLPPGAEPADDTDHGSSAGSVSVPDDFQDDAADPDGDDDTERDALLDGRLSVALGLLEDLRETDPAALAALEAYYGPDGDHYAKADRWGRGHALWPLTAGGKALLAVTREHGGTSRPLAALAAMRAAEAETPVKNIAWQAHMRGAVAESREILERARKALSEVA
jgi:hypothetical protein